MKKFAQIENNKVHWIFEAEEKPEFAPNIILKEITGKEEIQEGWDYDFSTNEFYKPKPEISIITEQPDKEKVAMGELIIKLDTQVDDLKLQLAKQNGGV